MSDPQLMDGHRQDGDYSENAIRPLSLRDFVGQKHLKDNLSIFIESARQETFVGRFQLLIVICFARSSVS